MFRALISMSKLVYKASIKYTQDELACLYKILYLWHFTRFSQMHLEVGKLTYMRSHFVSVQKK